MTKNFVSIWAVVAIVGLTACGEKSGNNTSSGSASLTSTGGVTTTPVTTGTTPEPMYEVLFGNTIIDHHINSKLISCDKLNPYAIRTLDPAIIELLGSQLENGLTLHHHYMITVSLGYTGWLGQGEGNKFFAAYPGLVAIRDQLVADAIATQVPTFNSTKAKGYKGVFTCGGAACFLAGDCDAWGRKL